MIGFLFSCQSCGLKNRRVAVRFRHPNEGIEHYFNDAVTPALGQMHRILSPVCGTTLLTDIVFPAPAADGYGIGMEVPGHSEPKYPLNPDGTIWKKVDEPEANG